MAARVRAARGWRGLDLKELAEAMGYSTRNWSRVEAGEKKLDRDERERVAALCGVPVAFMEYGFKVLAEAELERRLAQIADDLAALRRGEEEPPEGPATP